MPGEGKKPVLFGADGRVAQTQRHTCEAMYEGGFQLPVPDPELSAMLRACCIEMEVAPGVRHPVAQIHPDVALCWVETLRGLRERDERIDALEHVIDYLGDALNEVRSQVGLPELGIELEAEEKEEEPCQTNQTPKTKSSTD